MGGCVWDRKGVGSVCLVCFRVWEIGEGCFRV